MERTTLFNELKSILSEHIPGAASRAFENLTEHTSMGDDLGIESLDIVNIVIDIENRYNIEIDNDSIRKMTTVGSCLNLIQEKLCGHCVGCNAAAVAIA